MRQYFSIIFLLLGLPIIFCLRYSFDFSKNVEYLIIFAILLIGLDLKKLNQIKANLMLVNLFLLCLGMIIIFVSQEVFTKQLIDLIVILYCIFLSLTYKNNPDKDIKLIYMAFLISLISIILIYITVSLSPAYWLLHGGRLYIGDTKNPNLVSWVALGNIITALYILNKTKIYIFYKFILIGSIPFSLYLYFISFSKSTTIGLFFIILFYLKKSSIKIIFNQWILVIFIIILVFMFYNPSFEITKYLEIIKNTFNSLIYGNDSTMSALIRHENFKYVFEHYNVFSLFGYGPNTFRMDSPILQLDIDLGSILASVFLIIFVFVPISIIFINKSFTLLEEYVAILYLFYFPNLFFHGTPYEWGTWLPAVLFYMIVKRRRKKQCFP